jgi:hypothetical protein
MCVIHVLISVVSVVVDKNGTGRYGYGGANCIYIFWFVHYLRSTAPIYEVLHRIHMFLGLPASDPLVRGMDPDPDLSILKQK